MMNAASGPRRKAATVGTSSGVPTRPANGPATLLGLHRSGPLPVAPYNTPRSHSPRCNDHAEFPLPP